MIEMRETLGGQWRDRGGFVAFQADVAGGKQIVGCDMADGTVEFEVRAVDKCLAGGDAGECKRE